MEHQETPAWAVPEHEALARLAARHERLERSARASASGVAAAMGRRRARTALVTGSVVVALLGLSETYARTHGALGTPSRPSNATLTTPTRPSLAASSQLLASVARSLAADNQALAGLARAIAATASAASTSTGEGTSPPPGGGPATPPASLPPLQLPSVNLPAVPSTPAPSVQATTGASSGVSPLG
ncbi:MAG: hypothetical protein M0004_03880 [Actinomycetota bacterium]|nr:hypothetical protein [Actinomycetota bacterium]